MWPFPKPPSFQGRQLFSSTSSQNSIPGVHLDVAELIRLRHEVGALSVGKKKRALSLLAGTGVSPFKGRGIDFEEVRRYQAGDEIRHMDWRVTARSGKPHLKLFREERERPVFFVVDFCPSMFFGTKVAFKSVIAARVGTLLAWASLKHGDRVGALIYSNQGHAELRPSGGRSGVLRFTRSLADMHARVRPLQPPDPSQAQLPMAQALGRLMRTAKPGSLVFLISDFRSFDDQALSALTRLRVHHEVIALMIFDPIEASPPPPGQYRISNGTLFATVDTTLASVVSEYRETFEKLRRQIEVSCRRLGIGMLFISTHDRLPIILQSGLQDLRTRRWHHHAEKARAM